MRASLLVWCYTFLPQYPAYRTRIGIMPVCGYLCGSVTNHFPRLGQELLGRLYVPVLREHRVNQIAISVYGSAQVTPFAVDLDICVVEVPGVASFTPTPGAQLLCNEWGEPPYPIADRLDCIELP